MENGPPLPRIEDPEIPKRNPLASCVTVVGILAIVCLMRNVSLKNFDDIVKKAVGK